jgi:acid phosphatase (class A)
MGMLLKGVTAFALFCAAGPLARAQDWTGLAQLKAAPAVPQAVPERSSSGYLTPAQLQTLRLPAPPAPGSDADKADLAAVLQWQHDRTDAQCAAAQAQADPNFEALFGQVSPFKKPQPAQVTAFFARVNADVGEADRAIKKMYQRPRPFAASSEVNPCLGRVQGFSYPSGHAAAAQVYQLILSDLLPRQGAIYMRAADQAGLNRVIGGAHYPTDVAAGKQLGGMVYDLLKADKAFAADAAALQQYLR